MAARVGAAAKGFKPGGGAPLGVRNRCAYLPALASNRNGATQQTENHPRPPHSPGRGGAVAHPAEQRISDDRQQGPGTGDQ